MFGIDLENVYNMCIYGKSWSGKGVFMNWFLMNFMKHIKSQNVFIMSPTFKFD